MFQQKNIVICAMLGEEIGDIVFIEYEDTSAGKVTHQYTDELDGSLSMKNTSSEQLKASIGMKANKYDSERNVGLLNDTISIMRHCGIYNVSGKQSLWVGS